MKQDDGFELEIVKSLPAYRAMDVACLEKMPVPTVATQNRDRNGAPLHRISGQAPFDIYGYTCTGATFIGAEVKNTRQRETSIPIVGPDKKGSGLKFHQLDALAQIALCRGVARIIWCNCGEIGVLKNDDIVLAHDVFTHALKSVKSSKSPPKGSKSIRWELFKTCEICVQAGFVYADWLLLD